MHSLFLFLMTLCPTHQLELGGSKIIVEIADTEKSLREGLKGRNHLPEGHGMLFVFETPRILSFWMKDTLIPLSIGFFDENQVLLQIADMFPPENQEEPLPQFSSKAPAQYALEVPLDWFRNHQVFPGMKFSFQDRSSSGKLVNHE